MSTDLTFEAFRQANRQRCEQDFGRKVDSEAMMSMLIGLSEEAGEVAGAVRAYLGFNKRKTSTPEAIGDEIADLVQYADLLAQSAGLTLEAVLVAKFNRVSDRIGSAVKLPATAGPLPQGQMVGSGEVDCSCKFGCATRVVAAGVLCAACASGDGSCLEPSEPCATCGHACKDPHRNSAERTFLDAIRIGKEVMDGLTSPGEQRGAAAVIVALRSAPATPGPASGALPQGGAGPNVTCAQCGGPVEAVRHCYAIPTCYDCLPPPAELEKIYIAPAAPPLAPMVPATCGGPCAGKSDQCMHPCVLPVGHPRGNLGDRRCKCDKHGGPASTPAPAAPAKPATVPRGKHRTVGSQAPCFDVWPGEGTHCPGCGLPYEAAP